MKFITKLNNVNLVDQIENASETNQDILVKKLDKIAKGKGILADLVTHRILRMIPCKVDLSKVT